jgi:succinate dehydrogenase/fumarate reductase flavoprotein subunit
MNVRDCDVLVIGGGLAAMRAALIAEAAGRKTTLLLKGVLGQSGSSAIAGGGLAAVMHVPEAPEDNEERHYADTLTAVSAAWWQWGRRALNCCVQRPWYWPPAVPGRFIR